MTPRMRKLACARVVVLWAATVSLAQQTPPPAPQTATIIGTVRDITGGTVPNASVVLKGPT
jgi:hypothetical protein